MRNLTLILAVLAAPAVAQETTVTPGNTLSAPPEAWLGDVPHLVVMGSIGGKPVDLQFLDIAAAEGIETFSGKREYLPAAAEGGPLRYGDFEVALEAVIDGVEKSFEFEFENDDFHAHTQPATFTMVGENFPEGLNAFLEAQQEWETAAGSVNDEIGGWTGTLTMALESGTRTEEGVTPDGMIGGYAVLELDADRFVISFTVPVAEYEIDD